MGFQKNYNADTWRR